MAAVLPGQFNTFVKSHDASNKMVIDFARNINKFAVNRYCQIVPVKAPAGYYQQFTIEEAGRIQHTDLRNFVWYDGADAPQGLDGTESFEFKDFRCQRYYYGFRVGNLAAEHASWNLVAQHSSIKARQAMTARTQLAVTAATTTGNYSASHVIDVTALSGNTGNWAQSTSARQDIKRSILTGMETILDDTLGAVEMDDIVLVISSGLAKDIAGSQEFTDYLKGSPDAYMQIRGELTSRNGAAYGLPDKLYGVRVEVEATRKVTTKKGETTSRTSVLPKATPFMVARPGGLEGVADAPNFSTLVMFALEEMTTEIKNDADNRRTIGRVVENIAVKNVAPATGILFQNAA